MDFWIGVLFGTIVGILLMTAIDMYYDMEEERMWGANATTQED